jgi:hypothetical protein
VQASSFRSVDIKAAKQLYSDKLDAAKAEKVTPACRDHKLFAQCKLGVTLPNQLTQPGKVRTDATTRRSVKPCVPRVYIGTRSYAIHGGRLYIPAHRDIA